QSIHDHVPRPTAPVISYTENWTGSLLSGNNVIPTFVAPAEAGVHAFRAQWRAPILTYRGRGAVSLLPALRTVRAVLPHTALRSVVIYIEIGVQERELARG